MFQLSDHFKNDNRNHRSDWLQKQRWFIKARQEHHRKEEIADKLDDQLLSLATETIMAIQIQVREFEARLDTCEARLNSYETKLDAYDVAITKALIENQELMDVLLAYRGEYLSAAYVLEDGRRVFKSEDGNLVKDEFRVVVGLEEIDPREIPDHHPTTETFFGNEDAIANTKEERQNLHQAQDKVDQSREQIAAAREKIQIARDRVEAGDLTVEDIDSLDADLLDAMPPSALPILPTSAMKHLSGIGGVKNAANAKSAFVTSSSPAVTERLPRIPEQKSSYDPMG